MIREWLIKKLGGYPDIESAIDSIQDSTERRRILSLAVKRLYNTIDAEDILRVHESGHWMLEGKQLSKGEQDQLIAEAKAFVNMKLWKVLQLDVKYQANRKMYLLAVNEAQLEAGKLWQFTLDAFKTRLKSIVDNSGHYNSKLIKKQ